MRAERRHFLRERKRSHRSANGSHRKTSTRAQPITNCTRDTTCTHILAPPLFRLSLPFVLAGAACTAACTAEGLAFPALCERRGCECFFAKLPLDAAAAAPAPPPLSAVNRCERGPCTLIQGQGVVQLQTQHRGGVVARKRNWFGVGAVISFIFH